MTRRQYGSGWLIERKGGGWGIRWREEEITPDGTVKRVLRYEALERMSRRAAANVLAARVSAAQQSKGPLRSRVRFDTLAAEWQRTVMPMYKTSTQKNHRHITVKHLVPRFGQLAVGDVTTQAIQRYIAQLNQDGYAPKTIAHIHDVLSAILRTGVKWGHLKKTLLVVWTFRRCGRSSQNGR